MPLALLQAAGQASLLLTHLAKAAPFGLALQFALGDIPALLAVDAEDFVLSYLLAEPPEQVLV